MSAKKLYIATFGCQMNEYDSLKMAQLLQNEYVTVKGPEEADLVLVNTCSIREKAEHKLYSLVGRFRDLKSARPGLIIGVGGCVAQQEGERLLKGLPFLDIVFGPQGLYGLPDMIKAIEGGEGPICATGLGRDFAIPFIKGPLPEKRPVRAFVTIMQGCDNFCTYCVVPYVRGRETSRPPGDILAEAASLVDQGVKEITLLGQNVNSYGGKGGEGIGFAGLLKMVSQVPGLARLRFTTSHPKDLGIDVMECFRDVPNLGRHLHLPVQSGSDRVLRRMNRHYTRGEYLEKVGRLRDICPDITLTTDIITGFPGETDEDFSETLKLLKEVEFEQIFAFKYSPRPFTKAAGFKDRIPEDVKARRLNTILELQNNISLKRHEALCGANMDVLIEGPSKADPLELLGRTSGNHAVNLSGPKGLIGRMVTVRIEKAFCHSLRGSLV